MSPARTFDVVVVGAGLIGSAAAKHLAASGARVCVIGPVEPREIRAHSGVFASHYDSGRITRILATDVVWARLAAASIARYPEIERAAGIRFHHPSGFLWLGPATPGEPDLTRRVRRVGDGLGVSYEVLDRDALRERFPQLRPPEGHLGLLEAGGAGFVDPRSMLRAQLAVARRHGAVRVEATATALEQRAGAVCVKTAEGDSFVAERVLVAAGAFTNAHELLRTKLVLQPRAETILLARITPKLGDALRDLPSIIYYPSVSATSAEGYLVPPTVYPDGETYLKIGVDFEPAVQVDTLAEAAAYFRSGGSEAQRAVLRDLLARLLPALSDCDDLIKPCIVTYSRHGYPMIDGTDVPGVYVATAGNGAAAKSSDEIGRLAALLVEGSDWDTDLEPALFAAELQSDERR